MCFMVLDHHLITLQLRCKAIATPHSDLGQRMQRKLAYYAEPQPAVYHFNETKVNMKKERTLISFDWALKRLLRDKANFDVLEGFLSTLLNTDIKIHKLLESESNKDRDDSKQNRVDILAEDTDGELLLIEVQGESEYAYFQRILFGASKLVTEYINSGQNYDNVKKVYSINIVYFDLGQGKDFVYHGKTEFRGVHNNDILQLSTFQRQRFGVDEVYKLYPEYYILKVNDFNQWSKVPLEQWIYFLSTSDIPEDADAPGLKAAREKLQLSDVEGRTGCLSSLLGRPCYPGRPDFHCQGGRSP